MQTIFTLATHDSTPPTPWSYWVVEGQLLAGAFPGSPDPMERRQKIKTGRGLGNPVLPTNPLEYSMIKQL